MQNDTIISILKKAAQKEDGSYLVYKRAASIAKDVHTKSVLNKFAEDELKHKEAIENFDEEGLEEQEINDAARQGISEFLTSADEKLGEESDFKDVLIYAAKREKRAFEFYDNMLKSVENPALKKLLQWLAQEELKHKESIEALFWEVMYR